MGTLPFIQKEKENNNKNDLQDDKYGLQNNIWSKDGDQENDGLENTDLEYYD